MNRVLVVTDAYGVLEVFGPYAAGSAELEIAKSDLEVWATESGDTSVEMHDLPLRDSSTLDEWVSDPESFYSVGHAGEVL